MGLSLPSFPTVLARSQIDLCGIMRKEGNYSLPSSAFGDITSTNDNQWPVSGLFFFSPRSRGSCSVTIQPKSLLEHCICSGPGKSRRRASLAHSHRRWKPHCRSRRGGWLPVVSFYCVYRAKGSSQSTPSAHSSPTSPVCDPFPRVHFCEHRS